MKAGKKKEPMTSKPKSLLTYQTSKLVSYFAKNIIGFLSLIVAVIALIQGIQSSRPKVILIDSWLKDVREFYNFDPDHHPNQTRYVCRIAIVLTSINEQSAALTGYEVVAKYKDQEVLLPNRRSGLTYDENWGSGKNTFPGFNDILAIFVLPDLPVGAWNNQDPLTGTLESMPELSISIHDTVTFYWDVEVFHENNTEIHPPDINPDINQTANSDIEKLFLRFTLYFANGQKIISPQDITCLE